jgi:hypothetical protein
MLPLRALCEGLGSMIYERIAACLKSLRTEFWGA